MRLTAVLFGVALAASIAPAALADECGPGEVVIKFSHVTAATGNPKGEMANELAARVNKELNGLACMEVYPNSQLYDDDKVLEAMILGDVQMAAPSLSKLEKFSGKLRVFDLPFLFNDMAAVDRFQKSKDGQALLSSMEGKGLTGLAYWHNGLKQMSANKPLLLPSDAKGLKFRIQQSDMIEAYIRAIGGVPQKMALAEVYGALQQGVVDAQENTWSNIYTQKIFEVQDGATETNHGLIDYLVVVPTDWWKGLDPKLRDGLSKILVEVTATGNAKAAAIDAANKKRLIDAGSKIRTLTPEQHAQWVKAMSPVWDKFSADIGPDIIAAAKASNAP